MSRRPLYAAMFAILAPMNAAAAPDAAGRSAVPGPPRVSHDLLPIVLGGVDVSPIEGLFVVALRSAFSNQAFCTGIIVAPQWILTADHCLFPNGVQLKNDQFKVWVGRQWNARDTTRRFSVSDVVLYPLRTRDVALVKLVEDIPAAYPPVRLWPNAVGTAMDARIAGWGRTSLVDPSEVPNRLQVLEVTTDPAWTRDGMISTPGIMRNFAPPGRGSAEGDSGGPLYFFEVPSQRYWVIGVISGADIPAKRTPPNLPNGRVHTAVYGDVFTWVMETIGQ